MTGPDRYTNICSVEQLTRRQEEILEFIDRYRDCKGFPPSVREIGDEFGLAPSTVHDHIRALERKGHLGRQPRRSRSLSLTATRVPQNPGPAGTGIPLVGRVAAGAPLLAEQNVEDIFDLPESWAQPGTFLLRVQGDSMRDAHILDGDLVLVRPQQSASNGDVVVALIEDEATVKRFRKTPTGIELHPENPAYAPIALQDSDGLRVRLIGLVVAVFRPQVARKA